MSKVVSLKNVYFGYEGKLVLENINVDIYEGDYFGIVGANGSGKSTLIKLMLNILKPLKGSIKLFDTDINKFKNWGTIGYVNQKATSFNTSFPATVEEVVGLNLFSKIGMFKRIKKKDLQKVYEVLEIVGMQNYTKKLIGNLSGGQQQKVFIARALISSPKIIFLDEPTVGIDMKSQEEFYELLERLNKEFNITIVIISHDIGIISEKVNKLACINNKRLIFHEKNLNISKSNILKEIYGDGIRILSHNYNEK
ncbi:metal ABC transporter ATP-binding protein [Tepidibacter thalassicus]|uniref:Zinc transport system ATP-binding protein n=1 Tax=Tepidibacter thalassicus DSM 15285 TaxID=1123350 RepID=A0A1M5NPQ7_9FIRM|nr:metal ABC transporter ATP-binding protein [Tepidibacter thalassicus]SHG91564.1 zinc transport system ATP-binding protein [Tepidibacter thalassicus DSM 15285]